AVQKDQNGERSAALSLYCSALEHFVPAIHCKTQTPLSLCYTSLHSLSSPLSLLFQMRQTDRGRKH
ncbi:hypothetical protein M9458_035662, partial [Cirrhinus mrigala]